MVVAAGACAATQQAANDVTRQAREAVSPGPTATARLLNAQGVEVGTVELEQHENGVEVEIRTTGVPGGLHGIHFHQVGACAAPDFMSAGGHFNPARRQHGFDNPQGPHAGDLRNLEVTAAGVGRAEFLNPSITISAGPNSLFDADGTSLVVHATADDYRTDPSGNSGSRIACGVISR
ncbi:MAG: superoxide dismutase family protein [Gemmatimonadetes bacterium]|nr:superoxide dismutase family protein [Gemmatimonadota bacterium]